MAPAQFEGDAGPPKWTVVVDRALDEAQGVENVLVHFLMDGAPHDRIVAGAKLNLFEGTRVVAALDVSEVFDLNPASWSGGAETAA